MLDATRNERITSVGPGTPMGEVMRRYWHPVAPAAELDEDPVKDVRLLGEDLVLYRDASGTLGLIGRVCPHRRMDMLYGIPDKDGLRCPYHGWLFDASGQCIEQPFETKQDPSGNFMKKILLPGYQVQEFAGLIWAYLGPAPAPELPKWDAFLWENAVREISISHLPCNWLQGVENSLDPVHTEWLHGVYPEYLREKRGRRSAWIKPHLHEKVGFDVYEYGVIKRRLLEGGSEQDDLWAVGHPLLMPYTLFQGSEVSCNFQWRIPVDDTNTIYMRYTIYTAAPGRTAPKQEKVPYYYATIYDERGRLHMDTVNNQDASAWVAQGPLARRDLEKLGRSDEGIILFRRLLEQQIQTVNDGGDPIGVMRRAEEATRIKLPLEEGGVGGIDPARLAYRPPLQPIDGDFGPVKPLADEVIKGWQEYLTKERAAGAAH
jgi:5,5'-dehydrodivanillate O-demethylase